MQRRKKLIISLGVVGAMLLAGCSSGAGNDDDSSPTAAGADPTATSEDTTAQPVDSTECTADLKGGQMTMGVGNTAQTLDPVTQNSGSNGGTERAALYDTLLRYDFEAGEFLPHLAESIAGNEDSTEWTLGLREGITFLNGDPLTAEVVKESIARHTAEGASSNIVNLLDPVEEMEVVDDLTLVFHLDEPYGTFPFILAGPGGEITSPAVVEEMGDEFGQVPAPGMGLGPYDVVTFAPGEKIVLEAKDDYWGGTVCIDELRFIHITGGQGTYEAFELDEVQLAYLTDARAIDSAKSDGVAGFAGNSYGGAAILTNTGVRDSEPATADLRVRQAVSLAIDPDVMNQRRWDGLGVPSSALIAPTESPLYPGVEGPPFDPTEAEKLVAEVKAEGWDGSIRLVCPDDPSNIEGAIAIQALLESVGIDVELSQVGVPDLINAVIVDANYDLACWGIGAQAASPWLALSGYHSESESNYAGYENPDMDVAIQKLQEAATIEDQRSAIGEIQEIWNETIPSVVYASPESYIAYSEALNGLTLTSWGTVLFHDAYMD